jgi:integrase
MRRSECARVHSKDFNWNEGTVTILGKGNRFRKAQGGNGLGKEWFTTHDSLDIGSLGIQTMLQRPGDATGIHCNAHSFRRGFCVQNVKSGLSNKVIQSPGGWESPDMVSHYAATLTFDDALSLYKANNLNNE